MDSNLFSWSRCIFAVEMVSCIFREILVHLRPGYPIKFPFLVAFAIFSKVGLKQPL